MMIDGWVMDVCVLAKPIPYDTIRVDNVFQFQFQLSSAQLNSTQLGN